MNSKACFLQWLSVATLALTLGACSPPGVTPGTEPATAVVPTPVGQERESAEPPLATAHALPAASPGPTPLHGWVRPSALAGSWYPADSDELAAMVDSFLEAVQPVDGQPVAIVVPHAGYVYSGPVAAYGFKQLAQGEYDVAVIIAADHQLPLSNPISVWTEGGFETPLGVVPVDAELARALVAADPRITSDPAAHQDEHPIEIELPFLQRVCPQCRIVPVLMSGDDEESVAALADALMSVLPGRRAIIIASTDLSHYPAYQEARSIDAATLAAIETWDPARVRETTAGLMRAGYANLATCACGQGPILAAMRAAQGLGADTVTVLNYANSGDSPYGDREAVVGYGALMFWSYTPPDLTQARQEELLKLARTTIAEYLRTGQVPAYQTDDPALVRPSGAFVTLRKGDELRGCIGHMRADTPLVQCVQEMAVAAASSDPRFDPLTAEELDEVSIEISVLSPLRRITEPQQIQVGTHGLVLVQGGRQGVLLPQVPVEKGWSRDEFLANLCLKAGLPANCWAEQPALYTFTAAVFGE